MRPSAPEGSARQRCHPGPVPDRRHLRRRSRWVDPLHLLSGLLHDQPDLAGVLRGRLGCSPVLVVLPRCTVHQTGQDRWRQGRNQPHPANGLRITGFGQRPVDQAEKIGRGAGKEIVGQPEQPRLPAQGDLSLAVLDGLDDTLCRALRVDRGKRQRTSSFSSLHSNSLSFLIL